MFLYPFAQYTLSQFDKVSVEVSIKALTFVISCCVTTVKMSGNCLVLVCKLVSRVVYLPTLLCIFLSGLMNMSWDLNLTFNVVALKLWIGPRNKRKKVALGLLNLKLFVKWTN